MRRLIEIYKYSSVRAASFELAELLSAVIDRDYTLVPLPTISRHVRERGFDHIKLFCKKMEMPMQCALRRRNSTTQVGVGVKERRIQAAGAYEAFDINPKEKYLLVDDVWTTGSSMLSACEVMRSAGAKNLAIAVIARS